MRLLDGRRVQVRDLLDEGLLDEGDHLEFRRPRSGESYSAEVTSDGRLRLPDGREFAAPSRAAVEVAAVGAIDGWSVWTVVGRETNLFALRQTLLSRASQESRSEEVADGAQPVHADSRHEMLTAARQAAESGEPHRLTVRDLLRYWGARSRGHRIVDRVSADLENHSLETRPDFRKVTLDSLVELTRQATVSDDEEAIEVQSPGSDDLDVGLTLGNVPSALGGLASVNPNDPLIKAMTIMRLNDFSQVAVMPSARTLTGAVTWRSIAKALANNPSAKLADAIEPPREHPFDRDLIDVLAELNRWDFVFVRNATNEVSGIVTAADVVELYGETATPFFIIGEIDHLLRAFISDEWTIEQVQTVCDPEGKRAIRSHDDLTFGDYQRVLEAHERFSALGWPLDRATFINRLAEVRELRNGVAHFDPDPLDEQDVASLRRFLSLLREMRSLATR
jgi:CBS domain-containing protein